MKICFQLTDYFGDNISYKNNLYDMIRAYDRQEDSNDLFWNLSRRGAIRIRNPFTGNLMFRGTANDYVRNRFNLQSDYTRNDSQGFRDKVIFKPNSFLAPGSVSKYQLYDLMWNNPYYSRIYNNLNPIERAAIRPFVYDSESRLLQGENLYTSDYTKEDLDRHKGEIVTNSPIYTLPNGTKYQLVNINHRDVYDVGDYRKHWRLKPSPDFLKFNKLRKVGEPGYVDILSKDDYSLEKRDFVDSELNPDHYGIDDKYEKPAIYGKLHDEIVHRYEHDDRFDWWDHMILDYYLNGYYDPNFVLKPKQKEIISKPKILKPDTNIATPNETVATTNTYKSEESPIYSKTKANLTSKFYNYSSEPELVGDYWQFHDSLGNVMKIKNEPENYTYTSDSGRFTLKPKYKQGGLIKRRKI